MIEGISRHLYKTPILFSLNTDHRCMYVYFGLKCFAHYFNLKRLLAKKVYLHELSKIMGKNFKYKKITQFKDEIVFYIQLQNAENSFVGLLRWKV